MVLNDQKKKQHLQAHESNGRKLEELPCIIATIQMAYELYEDEEARDRELY